MGSMWDCLREASEQRFQMFQRYLRYQRNLRCLRSFGKNGLIKKHNLLCVINTSQNAVIPRPSWTGDVYFYASDTQTYRRAARVALHIRSENKATDWCRRSPRKRVECQEGWAEQPMKSTSRPHAGRPGHKTVDF